MLGTNTATDYVLAGDAEIHAAEPNGAEQLQHPGLRFLDLMQDVVGVIVIREIFHERFVARRERPHQNGLEKVLRSEGFQLVAGGRGAFVAADDKFIP